MVNKNCGVDTMKRLETLYSRKGVDQAFAIMWQPNPVIGAYAARYPEGETEYPDPEGRALFWKRVYEAYPAELEDDSMPSSYLIEFDQGLMPGLLGADVHMMRNPNNAWISSMTFPLGSHICDLPALVLDRDNIWFRRYVRQMELYRDIGAGVYGVSHLTSLSGLNAMMEFLGASNAYYALADEPESSLKFIYESVEFGRLLQDEFFSRVALTNGGTFGYSAQWSPGRIIAESVDAFHMTSVGMFRQFGRDPLAKMISYYDGAMMHIHSNGLHLLEDVCAISGVICIQLGDDVNAGFRIYERMDELDARRGDVPLIISIPLDVFARRLERRELHGNVLYMVSDAPDVAESNRIMEKVRAYRR